MLSLGFNLESGSEKMESCRLIFFFFLVETAGSPIMTWRLINYKSSAYSLGLFLTISYNFNYCCYMKGCCKKIKKNKPFN